MRKPSSAHADIEHDHLDRMWRQYEHDDNLLATRVSYFLLAQSILVAVTAFLVNTVADLQGHPDADLRAEIFGLSIALNVVGLVLTLVFWYVFTLNFDNVGAVSEMLQEADPVFSQMKQRQAAKRHARWYYRLIFRKKGMNWVTVNFLPATLVFLCGAR